MENTAAVKMPSAEFRAQASARLKEIMAKRTNMREIHLDTDENGFLHIDEEKYPRSEYPNIYSWLEHG